jgi:transposase-like protein
MSLGDTNGFVHLRSEASIVWIQVICLEIANGRQYRFHLTKESKKFSMKIYHFFMALVMLTAFAACTSSDPEQQELALQQDLMDEHDAVMPKMGEFNQTKQKLIQVLYFDTKLDSLTRDSLSMVAGNMGEVEESMMTWMNQLQNVKLLKGEKKKHEEIMEYLNKQKEKMEKIGSTLEDMDKIAKKAIADHPVKVPGPPQK